MNAVGRRDGSKYRVAVIGTGPSGLFAARSLAELGGDIVQVDVIDRLPTPFGLVRYGVAPDHLKIKTILDSLHTVFDHDNIRFIGGVEVGSSVSVEDLGSHYDGVIYATGAQSDRRLDVPGEDLPGSHSATDFVSWYSGHPLGTEDFDLRRVSSVIVVGAGNVALDVVRLLAKHPEELAQTDVPEPVLAALRSSAVRDLHIVARRGAAQARFSSKELRELGALDHAVPRVDQADVPEETGDRSDLSRTQRSNLETLRQWATQTRTAARTIHFHFWQRPARILGADRVEAVQFADTRPGTVSGTTTLPAQLVIRAIGYRSVALTGLPFDHEAGLVPNVGGRVVDSNGTVHPGRYVTGWLKRGPTGVIGTNRPDAEETVRSLLADLETGLVGLAGLAPTEQPPAFDALLAQRDLTPTAFEGWLRIDAAERAAGGARRGPRVKIADWAELGRLARGVSSSDD